LKKEVDAMHKPKQSHTLVPIALALLILLTFALMLSATVTAQEGDTPEPTSEFGLNIPSTFQAPLPDETLNPQMLPSLTGVNGQAINGAVSIRSGPGTSYPRIGGVQDQGWIDIIGWNGWRAGRTCSSTFAADLDMWVQVRRGEQIGWIARCALDIRGRLTDLPVVTAAGQRTLQR
jgi:hypothetical protein